MIKAVIFDWDGTLGMTLHLWFEGYKSELKKLGYNFSDKEIIGDFFYEHKKAAIKYPTVDFDTLVPKVRDYVMSHVSSLTLYDGAQSALERLQENNIKLTLVSSSTRKMLKESLEHTGLTKFFPVMLGFDDVMAHKPDPKAFLEIIEIAKLDPETTIIIGDSHNDIIAAKATGIDSCLFLPEENKIFYDFDTLKETNPTYTLNCLQNFVEMVTKLQ